MVTVTATNSSDDRLEAELVQFLAELPEATAILVRTLAHAWQSGGGDLQVGKWAIRLIASDDDRPFTAGSLHKTRGEQSTRLELARVLLRNHGVSDDDWTHWSDDLVELHARGFDRDEKFPTLALDAEFEPAETLRLAQGLRDLAHLAQQ